MKATIAWILSALLLVGIVGGATILYNNYMEESKNTGSSDAEDDVPAGVVILAGKDKQNSTTTAKESQKEVTESRTEASETEEKAPETTHTHSHDTAPEITVIPDEGEPVETTNEDSAQITEEEPEETITEKSSETEEITEKVTEKVTEKITEAPTEKQTEEESESEYVSPYLAPDFTVYDINGKAVKLSDFRGQPIVLNFWARGCIYCVKEMPDFQAAYEKYGDEVVFLMVCHVGFNNTTPAYEQKLLDSNGYTFPAYYDTSHEAVYAYGINTLPWTWFIDREFDLYTYIRGMATAESLEYCIQLILQ